MTNFKKYFAAAAMLCVATAASAQDKLFEYPTPPDEMVRLEDRTGYLVEHFWERCNVVTAIKNRDAFAQAFSDYVSFMPYADAEVVYKSIDTLIDRFSKDPDKLLSLVEIAEATVYAPGAEYASDDVYLPFAKAASKAKKIPSDRKKYYAKQVEILEANQVGNVVPDVDFILADGSKSRLSNYAGKHTLIVVDDPDNPDCFFPRVRLNADSSINDLIDKGVLNVIVLSTQKYTPEWAESTKTINRRWIVGAAPNLADKFDLRNPPVIYYLDREHKILGNKFVSVDGLIAGFTQMNRLIPAPASQQPAEVISTDTDGSATE